MGKQGHAREGISEVRCIINPEAVLWISLSARKYSAQAGTLLTVLADVSGELL